MSVSLLLDPFSTFWDNTGAALAGTLEFYEAGTSTPLDTFTDSTGAVANSNPLSLTAGRATVYGTDNQAYKVILKDSSGATLKTLDNISTVGAISGDTRHYETLADAITDIGQMTVGDVVILKERVSGGGGGGIWDVITDVGTDNTYDIVHASASLSFQLRIQGEVNAAQLGLVGGSDEAAGIQKAIDLGNTHKLPVYFPYVSGKYISSTTINYYKYSEIRGDTGHNTTFRFTGGADDFFEFVGGSEAESLNAKFENLTIESATALTGTAIRARNFTNLTLNKINISNFDKNIHVDWGIGLYMDECNIVLATRGIQIGGDITEHGVAAGIRGSGSRFMDSITINNCVFSSNVIDISDSGSINSLGGLIISGGNCFESSVSPVAGKVTNFRIAGRAGIDISGMWFENPSASRTAIILSNTDYDAVTQDIPDGVIYSNFFLTNGGAGTKSIDAQRCIVDITGNHFDHLGGGTAITLADTTSPSNVGINTYDGTYDSSAPIVQSSEIHSILDPSRVSQLQSVSIGGSSGGITKTLKGTASLTFSAPEAVPGSTDQTITVSGAALGDMVVVSRVDATVGANYTLTAFVSAADTVTVRYTQTSGSPAVPASAVTHQVLVFRI